MLNLSNLFQPKSGGVTRYRLAATEALTRLGPKAVALRKAGQQRLPHGVPNGAHGLMVDVFDAGNLEKSMIQLWMVVD